VTNGNPTREPIAVLGMALRLPGGISTPDQFWQALSNGEDLIGTVPPERWDGASFQSSDPDEPGTTYDLHGGFIADVDAFDANFFGIHSREASRADPQQRILLELTWEALERSSINPQSLARSQTGIYIGISNSDWTRMLLEDPRKIDGYTGIGAADSVVAGRIAHFLGTYGPAEVMDTACSSSLVAVHNAVESLRRGEINLAIAGGANLILSPHLHVCFSRTGMLSRSGRCHTFDDAADGYVRGEACCAIVLKRLSDARRDGDPILAVIRGTAVNQDGRSAQLTAPNIRAQQKLMRSALADASLEPSAIDYVEAHGTGTPLGDPMEFLSIGAVYGEGRSRDNPLRVGSVKTNLGHAEGAAGLTGLIKVILMLQPGHSIAPHLHCSSPSSRIDWKRWPIEIPHSLTSWPESDVHFAGVSSFSFCGTNAHAILSSFRIEAESLPATPGTRAENTLLCISAADHEGLRALAASYVEFLKTASDSFADICSNALYNRARLEHRLVVKASDSLAAAELIERWLDGKSPAETLTDAGSASAQFSGDPDLAQLAANFLSGDKLPARAVAPKRATLPLYPFQRQRFWFGEPPAAEWRQTREQVWQAALAEADQESRKGPLGWNPQNYSARWSALERLTLAYARKVLSHAGAFPNGNAASAAEVMRNCGFQDIYGKLINRWLKNLAIAGALIESDHGRYQPIDNFDQVSLDELWLDVENTENKLTPEPGMLAYLRRSGDLLEDVLTGRVSPLETLFPGGSFDLADTLYAHTSEARYNNAIATSVARSAVRGWGAKRNVRVLEVGAGTGGTTSAVIRALPSNQTEYWFTDVSELFLRRARHSFAEFPFVRFGHFDLDREPGEQGMPVGYFDVLVAANVLHASRNLPNALDRVRRLLAPGGILLLIETTVHQTCFDMSLGLIEGWQHFEDFERADDPLLSRERWREVLEKCGFENTMVLPEESSLANSMGQNVILARRDFASRHSSEHVAESRDPKLASARKQPLSIAGAVSQQLAELTGDEQSLAIRKIVRQVTCRVCQLDIPPEKLSDRDRLGDLGIDSLIALELRSELGKALGLEGKISATIAFDTGTIGEMADRLISIAKNQGGTRSANQTTRDPLEVNVETLEAMTDAEVEKLLQERLGA